MNENELLEYKKELVRSARADMAAGKAMRVAMHKAFIDRRAVEKIEDARQKEILNYLQFNLSHRRYLALLREMTE